MIFHPLPLAGACLIDLDKKEDARGFFARTLCVDEFQKAGLESTFLQANVAFSNLKHTLRGLHFQRPPAAEVKLVHCTRGSLFDVIVDIRKDSTSFGKWHGELLTAENRRSLYVPKGFAHGYLTLEDNTEIEYLVSSKYAPALEGNIRWDDPAIKIDWPEKPASISPRDQNAPNLNPEDAIVLLPTT